MSKPKFTLGPWRVIESGIIAEGKFVIARIYLAPLKEENAAIEESIANAHLIAAAPLMYDALLSASRVFRMYEEHHALKGAMDKAEANGSIADDIEKLLAEARGEG